MGVFCRKRKGFWVMVDGQVGTWVPSDGLTRGRRMGGCVGTYVYGLKEG